MVPANFGNWYFSGNQRKDLYISRRNFIFTWTKHIIIITTCLSEVFCPCAMLSISWSDCLMQRQSVKYSFKFKIPSGGLVYQRIRPNYWVIQYPFWLELVANHWPVLLNCFWGHCNHMTIVDPRHFFREAYLMAPCSSGYWSTYKNQLATNYWNHCMWLIIIRPYTI